LGAILTIASATLAIDGLTLTINMAGVSGSLSPSSGVTGFTVYSSGVGINISSATAAGSAVVLVVDTVIQASAICTLSLASGTGTNLVDDAANTPTGQNGFLVVNNSTANPYCSKQQLIMLYDVRSVLQLSNDVNSRQGNQPNIQFILDVQAGELESALYGRYDLPSVWAMNPIPLILTKYVAATAAGRLWGRRSDKPKAISADEEWAENWIKGIMNGSMSIPGLEREAQPVLQDSDFINGVSQFDWVYGTAPSPTGPSGNQTGPPCVNPSTQFNGSIP